MLPTIVIGLTRQYDSEAADQMEEFWFHEDGEINVEVDIHIADNEEKIPPWEE